MISVCDQHYQGWQFLRLSPLLFTALSKQMLWPYCWWHHPYTDDTIHILAVGYIEIKLKLIKTFSPCLLAFIVSECAIYRSLTKKRQQWSYLLLDPIYYKSDLQGKMCPPLMQHWQDYDRVTIIPLSDCSMGGNSWRYCKHGQKPTSGVEGKGEFIEGKHTIAVF